jgi:iron complex transport system ATP-binding protein
LLDEPTSAQDLNQQHKILELLSQLTEQQDYSVVAIIHDLNHAIRYCHRCEVVSQGEIIVSGEPGTILDAATVESVWRYRPQVIETRTQRILC